MSLKVSAGGAVGAVLGGRGAGRALKWEFIVFLKENILFFIIFLYVVRLGRLLIRAKARRHFGHSRLLLREGFEIS